MALPAIPGPGYRFGLLKFEDLHHCAAKEAAQGALLPAFQGRWTEQANYPIKLEIYDLLQKIQEQDSSFSVYRRPEFHSDELSKAAVFRGGEYVFGRSGRGALFPAIQAMKMLEFFLLSLIETFVCETA